MESVHFPLWTYNPTTGKVKLDSADKSDTVSFAANAVSKELGENRFKQLVKKIGQDKAMEMLISTGRSPLAKQVARVVRP